MADPWIALVGERDLAKRAHAGIEASVELFRHDGAKLGLVWVPTKSVSSDAVEQVLGGSAGVWCVPGSPYENTAGALLAIRYAREHGRPFLGTCGGFQHALMEYSENVLGHAAPHQEVETGAPDPLIMKLSCPLVEAHGRVLATSGWYADTIGGSETTEEYHCSYGLLQRLEPRFAGTPLEFVARDEAGQARAFRLPQHRFFVGTLFQPERRALAGSLHPIVNAFFRAAVESFAKGSGR